jgi:hypothetical protein
MCFLRNNENYAAWLNQVGPVIGGVAGSISTGIGNSSVGGNQSVSSGSSSCPCQYAPAPILGCTTAGSLNYNPNANQDDGSCIASVSGCTDPSALNYNPSANVDCNGNVLGGGPSGPVSTGPTQGFDGGRYSNFNQKGFGGYNDQMWFND